MSDSERLGPASEGFGSQASRALRPALALEAVALPPAEVELWGTNAVLYSSGSVSECEVQERACRAWVAANFLTVVEVCRDRELASTLFAMHRPGVLGALGALRFKDGDVLVVADTAFEVFSADCQKWLRAQVTDLGKRLEVVPAAQGGKTP